MTKSAQKIHASTQKFTEIQNISDNIVIFNDGKACLVIEVQATNFTLLSNSEQQAKIYSYASLLNSLSFPIQILIRNKKIDITSYLKLLDLEIQKKSSIENEDPNKSIKLKEFIKQYKDFIAQMVKVNTVLDKKFYIIISFSFLEKGVKGIFKKEDFINEAKGALQSKAESLLSQFKRLSLNAKILEEEELIKLFYEIYNQESVQGNQIEDGIKTPIIKAQA